MGSAPEVPLEIEIRRDPTGGGRDGEAENAAFETSLQVVDVKAFAQEHLPADVALGPLGHQHLVVLTLPSALRLDGHHVVLGRHVDLLGVHARDVEVDDQLSPRRYASMGWLAEI